jgi:uncharacterized protein (TIGR00730 family)
MEKAYKNLDFLNSKDARSIRILSEYLEPQARFERYNITDTVVFFGSARAVSTDEAQRELQAAEQAGDAERLRKATAGKLLSTYYDDARELSKMMTAWSKSLSTPSPRFIVCSGGGPGIMEAANRGASEASGISIGLGISLPFESTMNEYITRELGFEFHYFFTRKFWFVYLAKALVVFPGGFGTMDELFELLTLIQTQKIGKRMPIVLYGKDFWSELINFDALIRWGTISPEDMDLIHVASRPQDAFDFLTENLGKLHLEEKQESEETPPEE